MTQEVDGAAVGAGEKEPTRATAPTNEMAIQNNTGESPLLSGGEARAYAGFWIRLVALLIDWVVLLCISFLLFEPLHQRFSQGKMLVSWVEGLEFLFVLLYYVVMTAVWGQTLGKMVLGIRVIRQDGQRASWEIALLRETVGKFVSSVLFGIGFLLAAFDGRKRTLHDRLASTYVMRE